MSQRLTEAWYRKSSLWVWLLWPLSLLYRLVTLLRRGLFMIGLKRTRRFPVPVIVVGNIAVGGTGKTPLTLALIERLRAAGFRPGVVSRGYGGRSAVYPVRVGADSSATMVGDEPLLLALRSGAPVVVDPVRPRAVERLLAETDVDVVLSDDGLQHYALARDIEICVVDGKRGLGNGHLLPMGPLREPESRLNTIEYLVGNGGTGGLHGAVTMHLHADAWQAVGEAGEPPAPGAKIRALAGIGNPQRFFDMLRAQGFEVVPQAFPDHHAYTAADLTFAEALPLVMTEKDAVKCRALGLRNAWYVPVTAQLPEQFFEALIADLRRLRVTR